MDIECHITLNCPKERVPELQLCVDGLDDWSFSRITDDSVLGKGVFCYATAHFCSIERAMLKTNTLSIMLRDYGFNPVRRKLEQTVSDERVLGGKWVQV